MGKYTTGLELTDAIAMMGAIEALHECRVRASITTRGQAHNGLAHIDLRAHFDVLPDSELAHDVGVSSEWPTRAARTFEGLLYNLCWQLDYAIQQEYGQKEFLTTE